MEAKELATELKQELKQLRSKNQSVVSIDILEKYLGHVEENAEVSLSTRQLEHQGSLAEYDARVRQGIEMLNAAINAGKDALNALVLINGGAVIALLGFLGAVVSQSFPKELGLGLTLPLLYFGSGVLLGALGFGFRYFSQACYSGDWIKTGLAFHGCAILFAVSGYVLFGLGIYGAYDAFALLFSP